jgi:hypothetical protein
MNGKIEAPSITHAAALLVVHGRVTIEPDDTQARIHIHAGMGAVFEPNEPYTLKSDTGAFVLIIESQELAPHARGYRHHNELRAPPGPAIPSWGPDNQRRID